MPFVHQYGSQTRTTGVTFNDEILGEVWKAQNRGTCYDSLELSKGLSGYWCPDEGIFLQKGSQGGGKSTVALDKLLVITRKTQETL